MSYRPPKNIALLGLTSFFNDLSSEMIQKRKTKTGKRENENGDKYS